MYQYWRIGIETFIAKPFLSEPYILWQAMSLFFEQILAYFIGFEKNPKSELSSLRLTTYYVRET